MNDDLNLKLSQLVDDELAKDESVKLFELVHEQPELDAKLQRYELLGRVIKSECFIQADADFVSKVSQGLEQEAVVFAPAWRQRRSVMQTLSAIAATIAVIAVIVIGGVSRPTEEAQPPLMLAENNNVKETEAINVEVKEDKAKVDPRFIAYLEAHDNSLYAAGSPGLQSYVRVVSYGQK
ncbi:MAG: sigma-E factor negative regulatory protein [Methyloprofundus sp.]|nr:sigma-E factor negative regulatory protein [Methyloprofundus sp.]